jgi:hypothetical protein
MLASGEKLGRHLATLPFRWLTLVSRGGLRDSAARRRIVCRANSKSPFGCAQSTPTVCCSRRGKPCPESLRPSAHPRNDVWVYVLTGEVGVLVGEEIAIAGPGEWALKPRDVLHAMWNSATEAARIIEVLTPGGSERWFEELAGVQVGDRAVSRRRAVATASNSSLTVLGPRNCVSGSRLAEAPRDVDCL